MAELTVEEARKIYNESDSLKSLMLTKYTKDELEPHEVTQEEFDKTFLKLLEKCIKTVYFDEHGHKSSVPTSWMELMADENDRDWILDIKYTGENKHFETYEEAKDYLIKICSEKVESYKSMLARAEKDLADVLLN